MKHKTYEIGLEDIAGVNLGRIEDLLEESCHDMNDPPAAMVAAQALLQQARHHLNDLHAFLTKEIGKITVTIPDFNSFYFNKMDRRAPSFLGARLIPKKTTEAAGEPEPQAVKKLAGEGLKEKEPVTDPKTIESYRSSIEQLLGALDPAARTAMLFDLEMHFADP